MNIIHDLKTERFQVLFALYIATEADYEHAQNLKDLAESRGITGNRYRKVMTYLSEEGFIGRKDGGNEHMYTISHKGIKIVEEVFLDQYAPTYYFPPYREMMR